jgi:hypothetical protein
MRQKCTKIARITFRGMGPNLCEIEANAGSGGRLDMLC